MCHAGIKVNYIDQSISAENRAKIRAFTDILNQAMTEITGVDPTHEFDIYCNKLSYFGWSHTRDFWNILDCSDDWFNMHFYQQYSHEMAQLFFAHNIPGITDALNNGIYDAYFSPHYVLRPSEHISFALDSIFWTYKTQQFGLTEQDGTSLPYLGNDISLDSEFSKVLSTIDAGLIHHTETNYYDFLNFSFYAGQMLFVKLYQHDNDFLKRFISSTPSSGSFDTVKAYADAIISAYKAGGKTTVDGILIEDFVWNHPDFRRFTEDYNKKYYFDILLVDNNKRMNLPWHKFFNFSRINPSHFDFAGTSFKYYTADASVFNTSPDDAIHNWSIDYQIINDLGQVVASGTGSLMEKESSPCGYTVPKNLPNGVYTINASVTNAGETVSDSVDFVINTNGNFYTAKPMGYNYLIMKNIRLGNSCYYLKFAYYGDHLKLEEINTIHCSSESSNSIIFDSQGLIQLNDIDIFGTKYNLELIPQSDLEFEIHSIE
jgi:hypothetical protein